jgi:uncharacterized protein (TIGR02453 family)
MKNISKSNFQFLKDLTANNNRDWFQANKETYIKEHQSTIDFADAVLQKLSEHDNIETPSGKKSLFRIYRDVRFGKNKSPYKINWSGGFRRATKYLRGGYYFHIQPGNSFAAGGFWAPNPEDLRRIRDEIAFDDSGLKRIINSKNFVNAFGAMEGDQVKTAPKGFPRDHKAIELLRYKQFLVSKRFTDKEVLEDDFYLKVDETFRAMRPFFNYMSDVLTTDANGELRKDL